MKIKVLLVCGTGTLSSIMLSSKLTDALEKDGYAIEITKVILDVLGVMDYLL